MCMVSVIDYFSVTVTVTVIATIFSYFQLFCRIFQLQKATIKIQKMSFTSKNIQISHQSCSVPSEVAAQSIILNEPVK